MATETATAAPAASAETPARDWSALGAELGETPETSTPVEPAKPSTETAKPAAEVKPGEAAPATPETPAADEALTRLDEIIKGQEPAAAPPEQKAGPVLTPEAQQLQYWQQNPEFAQVAVTATTRYLQLEQAASNGDVPGVLSQFAPQFNNALLEHIYQQHKTQIVERFIAEAEGRPAATADPRVAKLEHELAQIRGSLTERQQRETQAFQQQSSQQLMQAFDQNWSKLFDAVKVTDPIDRDLLEGAVMRRIAKDPKAAKNVQEGRFGDINKVFRDVFSTWRDRQKGLVTATEQVRNQQEQKKSGQLTSNSAAATEVASGEEPETDEDGRRTQNFLKKQLSKIPGWFD